MLTSGEALLLLRAGAEEPLTLAIGAPSAVAFDPTGARVLTVHGERAVLSDTTSGEALERIPSEMSPLPQYGRASITRARRCIFSFDWTGAWLV